MLKYKNELTSVQKKLDLSIRDRTKLEKELGKMENSMITMKEQVKKSTNGEKSNKGDFKQTVFRIEQKMAQVIHEMRKKESMLTKMQEQYRKVTKENLLYKNCIDICAKVDLANTDFFKETMPEEDLCYMLKNGYEESQKRLVDENSRLKECLELTHKEVANMLNGVVNTLKQIWKEGKGKEIAELEPIQLKPIVFQMPLRDLVNDVYQIFRENIYRMKDCLDAILSNC